MQRDWTSREQAVQQRYGAGELSDSVECRSRADTHGEPLIHPRWGNSRFALAFAHGVSEARSEGTGKVGVYRRADVAF